MTPEIPEADYYEVVMLTCPVKDCPWEMEYGWCQMDNRRPAEYIEHYTAEHPEP